ncbi:hypothetical protein [Mycobacterium sp.]|uniref:hypothetical protein n=1 Tax=Mycobacterium sp. TaxID=1785 RepID=UPI003F9CF067
MTAPSDPQAQPTEPPGPSSSDESRTRIIRRAPTGPIPTIAETPTTHIPREAVTAAAAHGATDEPSSRTAVAACAVSIVSGWATSVVATALITGWWQLNRLFCIAVAFLALVFGISTVWGVVALLQRRPIGRWLIVVGAIVALVTYGGLFIAGAQVAWIVYIIPTLPLASIVLALHPRTKRWLAE